MASIIPLKPFGVKIKNIDLKTTISKFNKKLINLLDNNQLIIVPNQFLNPKDWVKICNYIGRVTKYKYFTHYQHPEIILVTPDVKNGKKIGIFGDKNVDWHTNGTARENPENGLGIYCVKPGINSITSFANCHLAFEKLPSRKKIIYDKIKIKFKYENDRFIYSSGKEKETLKKMGKGCIKPLCIESPVSKKKGIYFGINYIRKFIGIPEETQKQLIAELYEYIFQEKHIYHHSWSKGDCLFADQYLTQHKRNSFTGKRMLYRTVFYYG